MKTIPCSSEDGHRVEVETIKKCPQYKLYYKDIFLGSISVGITTVGDIFKNDEALVIEALLRYIKHNEYRKEQKQEQDDVLHRRELLTKAYKGE